MGWRELEDVAECGPGRGDVAVSQVLIERRRVELSATADPRVLEQGLELRGEHELAIRPRIEQRLLADPIAGQEQESPLLVPDREGEHAAKPPQASRPILLEGMDDDLGVAPGGEPVSVCLQLGAQLEEIVDLAVERHPDRAVLVAHRLPAAGQVDDAEPALAEADVALDVEPLVVGAAMREAGAKAIEDRLLDRTPLQVQDPRNAAHRSPLEENSLNLGTHGKTRKERGFREPFVRSEPRDSVAAPFPCLSVVTHVFIVPFVPSEPRDDFQS